MTHLLFLILLFINKTFFFEFLSDKYSRTTKLTITITPTKIAADIVIFIKFSLLKLKTIIGQLQVKPIKLKLSVN